MWETKKPRDQEPEQDRKHHATMNTMEWGALVPRSCSTEMHSINLNACACPCIYILRYVETDIARDRDRDADMDIDIHMDISTDIQVDIMKI